MENSTLAEMKDRQLTVCPASRKRENTSGTDRQQEALWHRSFQLIIRAQGMDKGIGEMPDIELLF